MKFTVETILSLRVDGASAHILSFNNTIKVLLDCGISRSFDFTKYLQKIEDLKSVCLVLISHSLLEYSGAIGFLVDQIGMNPKIFYTTQPIMRYSPLNLHEELLNLRSRSYGKKTFNKIYKIYESINIIKPLQKKCINLFESENDKIVHSPVPVQNPQMEAEEVKTTIGQVDKQIYFTCFCAGSHMGSLAWRLSFGIVNILYMVEYNNYSLYHINGLNLEQIMAPTDIFITDTYRNIDDSWIKKASLYNRIKDILIRFYEKNGMNLERPSVGGSSEMDRKIVFTCSPNQMLVEIMAVVKKIIEDLQPPENRQKIRVVHLSSRFLQLIKSQMDYFSPYFKDTLENIEQYFIHSKEISGRINIATFSSLQGLLCNSNINTKPIEIYHFGEQISAQQILKTRREGEQNITRLKIFIEDKLIHSASKISLEMLEQKEDSEVGKPEGSQISEQKQQTISQVPDEAQIIPDAEIHAHQPLHSKYFSQVGFPRFTNKFKDKQYIFDDYGCRHEYARFNQRMTIEEYKKNMQLGNVEPVLQKKNSTIEIMNIEFKISPAPVGLDFSRVTFIPFHSHKTNFISSVQLITSLKPDNVILINTDSRRENGETLSSKYQSIFKSRKLENQSKLIKVYDLAPKNYRVLEIENELISYKVNYIPIPQERKLQKVKGLITYSSNGLLYIHLDCLEEKEHLDFRLDKFYKRVKQEEVHQCIFTKNGLYIDGVRIYRENKRIVLEGYYSEQYFKVRRMLYDFLAME